MALKTRRINSPTHDYSVLDESQFRRVLENHLFDISSDIDSIQSGSDVGFSLRNKMVTMALMELGEESVPEYFMGSDTWNPGSVNTWGRVFTDVPCAGARVGMAAMCSLDSLVVSPAAGKFILLCAVRQSDYVRCEAINTSGTTRTLGSGTVRVRAESIG